MPAGRKPARVYTCPVCTEVVRQREPQVLCSNQRWHRACWPQARAPDSAATGRPPRKRGPTPRADALRRIGVQIVGPRVPPDVHAAYVAAAQSVGLTLPQYVAMLLRRAEQEPDTDWIAKLARE